MQDFLPWWGWLLLGIALGSLVLATALAIVTRGSDEEDDEPEPYIDPAPGGPRR